MIVTANIDTVLAGIARSKMRVPTLLPRNSDHLDFHQVSVTEIANALRAAYEAGRAVTAPPASVAASHSDARYRAAARERYPHAHLVKINSDAAVNTCQNGAYVAAWLWVTALDLKGHPTTSRAASNSPARRRTRCGSWRTFERRFGPIDSPDGNVYWSREQLPSGIDEHRVWTIVDGDGKLYVTPGYRLVNRIGYVVCERPWCDDDMHQPDYRYD